MIQVATFKDINRITTLFLPKDDQHSNNEAILKPLIPTNDDVTNQQLRTCRCREMKTQVRITTSSNDEDLVITCNGYNVSYYNNIEKNVKVCNKMYLIPMQTATSIADLIEGYCLLISNNQVCTLWNPIGNTKNEKTNDIIIPISTLQISNGEATTNKTDENSKPKLSEDYAELGLVDDEGDYSTPAGN